MGSGNKRYLQNMSRLLFGLYILLLIYFMFFAEQWGRSLLESEYRYNLVPFREIRRYLQYYRQIGAARVFLNLAGNVLGFVPFGALLPTLKNPRISGLRTVFLGFELSLLIEISQLVLRAGSFDVDDLMLNTLGCAIGFLIYRAGHAAKSAEEPDGEGEVIGK